jgi:hypothetical protein
MTPSFSHSVKTSIRSAYPIIGLVAAGVSACANAPPPSPANAAVNQSFLFTTPPGAETHWCQYMRLPKSDSGELMLTGFQWKWSGLHHWSLYPTTSDLPADTDFNQPFDCFAPGAMKYASPASLLIAGDAAGARRFPPTTGFALRSEDVVLVQAHTVNASSAVAHPTLDVSLELARPESITNRLGLIQFYDPYIVVPADADARAQMRCRLPKDMTILAGTTHQHMRGTDVKVFFDAADGTPGTQPVVESLDWEHPTVLDNELHAQAGSYVHTVCQYHGDDHPLVVQGQDKLDNEMCMFIGYYYPMIPREQGGAAFENCVQTPQPGGVGDAFGTGTRSCAESLSCIQSCPPKDAPRPMDGRIDVGACWQKCIVDSCASASAPLDALSNCVRANCAAACAGGSSSCSSCVIAKCGGQYAMCQSQTC